MTCSRGLPWPGILNRPLLPRSWDRLLWGLSGITALSLLVGVLFPAARDWVSLFILVSVASGPATVVMPFAAEPLLMAFGKLHEPLTVALVATAGMVVIEFFNFRLYTCVLHARPLKGLRKATTLRTIVRWFAVAPFVVVVVAAFTPIPFDVVRGLATLSHYSFGRYLSGMVLGRLPRVWLVALTGSSLPWSPGLILAVGFGLVLLVALLVLTRRLLVAPSPPPVGTSL